jgi:hypothetical protein
MDEVYFDFPGGEVIFSTEYIQRGVDRIYFLNTTGIAYAGTSTNIGGVVRPSSFEYLISDNALSMTIKLFEEQITSSPMIDSIEDLIALSRKFIEPKLANRLARSIYSGSSILVCGPIEISQNGVHQGDEVLAWRKYADCEVTPQRVHLFKKQGMRSKILFSEIPRMCPNSILLPEILRICAARVASVD